MSGITDDTSTVLAPFRGSFSDTDRQSPVPLPTLQPNSEVPNGDEKISSVQPDHESVHSYNPSAHIRHPSPGSTFPSVNSTSSGVRDVEVSVKAEIPEDTFGLSHKVRPEPLEPTNRHGTPLAEASPAVEGSVVSRVVASLKNDESYQPSSNTTEDLNHSKSVTPKPAPTRKRAAPKKGTASAIKPPLKKRKIDTDSIDGTPSLKRSATPASSRASKTPAPKSRKQDSATPTRSSSVAQPDDDENASDSELFCICRKPDDHTWMIGCDGSCEDWFHGRCVDMSEEDGKIIDKWICRHTHFKANGRC